jgi:L-alanine-DL-glutamate epimerase-like enolase superfamily enzyme
VNLKLMKLGGLTSAVKALNRAVELGMRVMLGSMIETSIGVTAMAHLAARAEWLDLDASNLISNDPFDGLIFDRLAVVSLPERVGCGVIRRI